MEVFDGMRIFDELAFCRRFFVGFGRGFADDAAAAMPPPARAAVKPWGQWSRPPGGLILGVRPNSPAQRTMVESNRSRAFELLDQRGKGGIEDLQRPRTSSSLLMCVSQPLERHFDAADADFDQLNGRQAGAAEGRVAELLFQRLGAPRTSNALSCSDDIILRAARCSDCASFAAPDS